MKYLFLSIIIMMTACRNTAENATIKDSVPAGKKLPDTVQLLDSVKAISLLNGTHCFAYTKNRDTILMRLVLKDSLATGKLIYNLYEKDKNKGTFKGFLNNDTLLANYTFSSEGMMSVRQVIFYLKGDIFLAGSGSMKEQNSKLVFSNKRDISFDNNLVLKMVDCSLLSFK